MAAYEAMAKRAGLTLAQAAEMRYEKIQEELKRPGAKDLEALKEEAAKIGTPRGAKGSQERSAWFRAWELKLPEQQQQGGEDGVGDGGDPDMLLMRMLMARPGGQDMLMALMGGASASSAASRGKDGRRVRAPDITGLKTAVDEHPDLEWDARMATLAGVEGVVITDDPADGTSNVSFQPPVAMEVWLPTVCLSPVDEPTSVELRPRGGILPARDRPDAHSLDATPSSSTASSALALGGASANGRPQRAPLIPFDHRLRQGSPATANAGRGSSPIIAAGDQVAESRARQTALRPDQRSYDGISCGRGAAASKATGSSTSAAAGGGRRALESRSSAGRGSAPARGIVPSSR